MSFKSDANVRAGADLVVTSVPTPVGVVSAEIVAANTLRREVMIIKGTSKVIFLGEDNTVTTANGLSFSGGAGAALVLTTAASIFAITSVGATVPITVMEFTDLG